MLQLKEAQPMFPRSTASTFRSIVNGLLGLVVDVGWCLGGIPADLREVHRKVARIQVEAAVTNTKVEDLIAEFHRRNP